MRQNETKVERDLQTSKKYTLVLELADQSLLTMFVNSY